MIKDIATTDVTPLHEAAKAWANRPHSNPRKRIATNSFIAGARWMEEYQKNGPPLELEMYVPASANYIIMRICSYLKVRLEEVVSKNRQRPICEARQIAMFFLRKLTTLTLKEIGQLFGGRDHTTVVHANTTIENLVATDIDIRKKVETLARML